MMMFMYTYAGRERESEGIISFLRLICCSLGKFFFECEQCKATNGSLLTATAKDE